MMRTMAAALLVLAAALPIAATPASAQTIGVVLMHGNTASPHGVIYGLALSLQGTGYLVDTPEMCWSKLRIYDRSFVDCLAEIDSAIGRLKGSGAARIVVAGHSQGGDAALAYGAQRTGLAGIIALAPGAPEWIINQPETAQSVVAARALVAAGRGSETATFTDHNAGGSYSVHTTAAIYLSYRDPQGPDNLLASVKNLRAPLLWVAGTADRSQTEANAEFAWAPANPLNRFVTVAANHGGTPYAAREAVLAWLQQLK